METQPNPKHVAMEAEEDEVRVSEKVVGASLVAQWLRICLPMQGTRVRALVGKIPHAAEQLGP